MVKYRQVKPFMYAEKSAFVTEDRSLSGGLGQVPLFLPAGWRESLTQLLGKLFLPIFHKDAFDFVKRVCLHKDAQRI